MGCLSLQNPVLRQRDAPQLVRESGPELVAAGTCRMWDEGAYTSSLDYFADNTPWECSVQYLDWGYTRSNHRPISATWELGARPPAKIPHRSSRLWAPAGWYLPVPAVQAFEAKASSAEFRAVNNLEDLKFQLQELNTMGSLKKPPRMRALEHLDAELKHLDHLRF